ncbi:MAG: nuclear transport factor 2 family protein [Acidobacteriota bacterium]|nr:nuclear transport factor 2 family protein [Acidobacteriota bacterium]
MKTINALALAFAFLAAILLASSTVSAQTPPAGIASPAPTELDALRDSLVAMEKKSWEAWKNRDGRFFQDFLSEDHVEVGFGGVIGKAQVVAGVGSPVCVVKSYAVDRFRLTALDANTAVLTYYADQDTLCGGHPVPSPVWATSLYVRRGGRWWNALYQQTQTARK